MRSRGNNNQFFYIASNFLDPVEYEKVGTEKKDNKKLSLSDLQSLCHWTESGKT